MNASSSAEGDVRMVTVTASGCQQSGDMHIRQEPARTGHWPASQEADVGHARREV
jgi:hypothetical protein